MCKIRFAHVVFLVLLVEAALGQARDRRCRMRIDGGECRNVTRYRFNPDTRRCVPFDYRGEGGNRNNFNSLGACRTRCEMDRPLAIGFQLGR